jgi:hypothetical protein
VKTLSEEIKTYVNSMRGTSSTSTIVPLELLQKWADRAAEMEHIHIPDDLLQEVERVASNPHRAINMEEYEALEARKPIPAEVIAELPALLVGDLRHALESATPDTRMGCLLRNLLPYLRKPQVDAEVIERARRWAQQLRLWPRMATPTEDGLRLIPEDCLRRCSAAFDALLAAVEAAPDEERLTPIADMTLDEQIDELATYMPEQMPVLAVLLDEETLPKVLQSFRNREAS